MSADNFPAHIKLVKGGSYYFEDRNSIGIYVKNRFVTLIDSGIDEATAKKINNALKAAKLTLKAIINTHSHADHCGGNNFFQKTYTDLKIYATSYEKAFIEDPRLEPICFCSGAAPFQELRNKFLEALPSTVTNPIAPYQDQLLKTDFGNFRIITLPGHTPGMIGVITEENVLYTGDAIFGVETFTKHGVLFYTNIEDTLASFKKLSDLEPEIDKYVFYHGGLSNEKISQVIQRHQSKIMETKSKILELISEGALSLDELTAKVINHYEITQSIVQFTLTRSCVTSYVTHLQKENQISLIIEKGGMLAKAKDEKIKDKRFSIMSLDK